MSKDTEKAVKLGRIFTVDNKDRAFGSALKYNMVWVEDSNGKNERALLFTSDEIEKAEARAERNPEDIKDRKWLRRLID
jgi:hypothetical protein